MAAYHGIKRNAAAIPGTRHTTTSAIEPNRMIGPKPETRPGPLCRRGKWLLTAKPCNDAARISAMNGTSGSSTSISGKVPIARTLAFA